MKKTFILALLALPCLLQAQIKKDSAQFFLVLNNGKTIYSNQLTQKDRILRGGYILVNGSDRYDLKDVKSYRSPDGFFRKFGSDVFPTWYKEEEQGKINVYSRIVNTSSPGTWNNGVYMGGYYSTSKVEYYQIGEQTPQKLKYAPLQKLMTDSPASLAMLKKGKNKSVTKGVLFGAGLGMFIAGAAISLGQQDTSPPPQGGQAKVSIHPLVIVGALSCVVVCTKTGK